MSAIWSFSNLETLAESSIVDDRTCLKVVILVLIFVVNIQVQQKEADL